MMRSSDFRSIVEPIKRAGRYTDTELVHVSPRERAVMKRLFGPETTNPKTGLPEHFLGELLGLGGYLGGWASEALDLGLSDAAASALGNAVIGGGIGALTGGGKGAATGALLGGAGGYFLPEVTDWLGGTDVGKWLGMGGDGAESAWPDWADTGEYAAPETASEGLSGMGLKKALDYAGVAAKAAPKEKEPSFFEKYKNPLLLGGGALLLLSMLNKGGGSGGGTPAGFAPVPTNRAPINVNLPKRQFVGAPVGGQGGEGAFFKYAHGGRARGPGGPRDDRVPAMLSDGEHVIDTETVSLMGDGSNDRGHEKLERLKREVRQKKGRALSRGRISPPAGALARAMGGR